MPQCHHRQSSLLNCLCGLQGPADEEATPAPASKSSAPDFMALEPAEAEPEAEGEAPQTTEAAAEAKPEGNEEGAADDKAATEKELQQKKEQEEKQKAEDAKKAEEAKKAAKPPKIVDEPLLCAFRYFDRTGKHPLCCSTLSRPRMRPCACS